jgi:hypothetical protein
MNKQEKVFSRREILRRAAGASAAFIAAPMLKPSADYTSNHGFC